MTNSKTIFLVVPRTEKLKTRIHAAFDSVKKAKAFQNRFKTPNEVMLMKCHVDPKFQTNKANDCYLIELNRRRDKVESYLVNNLDNSDPALKHEYFTVGDHICIYGMAAPEKEAIKIVRKLKAKAIVNSKFDHSI